jgi:tetratricopeptide (TPR) repeat protein
MLPMLRNRYALPLALLALFALASWALAPGLQGGFLFDDYVNLNALGAYGRVDNAATLARYVTSGSADPIGRPLALLSFLTDARDWPADPYPFKLTNLLLHLLNGSLLFGMLGALGRALRVLPTTARWAAVLGSGLWMLHPLFVSTTLYIVQREAMLPATLSFAAIWCWLAAREVLLGVASPPSQPSPVNRGRGQSVNSGRSPFCWATVALVASVLLGTGLATLAKANGLLLPLLLLVIEWGLPPLHGAAHDPSAADGPACDPRAALRLRWLRRWLLGVPSFLLLAWMASQLIGATQPLGTRPWTLAQRLLTEPRVLWDYLGLLWSPHPYTRGLFNDTVIASISLWQPAITAWALLGILALAVGAVLLRRWQPALAIAILFYLAGQSLESGPVALELYFEHRNYLPAALMFWPLALWLVGSGGMRPMRYALVVVLPLMLAAMTHAGASLWGNPAEQALVWAAKNPDSPRAQAYAAQFELQLGQPARAEARLRAALARRPLEPQLVVNYAGVRCANGGLRASDIDLLDASFRSDPDPGGLGGKWLTSAVPLAFDGGCHGLGPEQLRSLLAAFAANPRTPLQYGRRVDVAQISGRIELRKTHPDEALRNFQQALAADSRPDVVLVQTAMLATAGEYERALQLLTMAQTMTPKPWYRWRNMGDVHQWVLYRQGYWQSQTAELRGKIEADLRAKQAKPQ